MVDTPTEVNDQFLIDNISLRIKSILDEDNMWKKTLYDYRHTKWWGNDHQHKGSCHINWSTRDTRATPKWETRHSDRCTIGTNYLRIHYT